MGKQLGFYFDADRCVMCHTCELACKGTRNVELGVNWRKVIEIWEGEFPDVTRTFVSLSCFHCAAPPCQPVCPTGAISKRQEDGIVVVDTDLCTGCRECYSACPYRVPQFGADGTMQKCDLCLGSETGPACTSPCPADALFSGTVEELARMAARKGGHKVGGPGDPSFFISNRRGPAVSVGRLVIGQHHERG